MSHRIRRPCAPTTRFPSIAGLVVAAAVATACSDGEPVGPADDGDGVSAEIGPAGGNVTSKDGALTLEIPAGALTETRDITIEVTTPGTLGGAFSDLEVAAAWELGPDGLAFQEPVTATFRSDASPIADDGALQAPAQLLVLSDGAGTEELLDSVVVKADADAGTVIVRGELSHFSTLSASVSGTGPGPFSIFAGFRVDKVPDQADGGFRAEAQVRWDPLFNPTRGGYIDDSRSPVEPTFTKFATQSLVSHQIFSGEFTFDAFDGAFEYVCTGAGDGLYRSIGVIEFESLNATVFLEVSKSVTCVAPSPPSGGAIGADRQWFLDYDLQATSCPDDPAPDDPNGTFQVDVDLFNPQPNQLKVSFPEGTQIVLDYDASTGAATGSGEGDLGSGVRGEEAWQARFFLGDDGSIRSEIAAHVRFIDSGTGEVICERLFTVDGGTRDQ